MSVVSDERVQELLVKEARLEIENERLRAALKEAEHYVVLCPPPPEATGNLRIELLEQRARIEQAARALEQRPSPTKYVDLDGNPIYER